MKKSCSYSLYYHFFKKANKEKCKVKVLPWQQFVSENCREVMVDLYEDIVKVWEELTFMLSCKEQTGRYALKFKKNNGCQGNNFCHFFMKLQSGRILNYARLEFLPPFEKILPDWSFYHDIYIAVKIWQGLVKNCVILDGCWLFLYPPSTMLIQNTAWD